MTALTDLNAQDNRRSWLVVIGLSLGPAVSNGIARFAYGLILPAMRTDLDWTYTEAGWINTANAVGYLAGSVLALYLISHRDPRQLFIGGMLLTIMALLFSATTRDFWLLTCWRILAGLGGAAVLISGGTMASTLFRDDPSRNALAIAIYFGGAGLGLLISGLTLPLMLDHMGTAAWPQTWLALGLMGCIAFFPSLLAVRTLAKPEVEPSTRRTAALPIGAMAPALAGYFLYAVGYIVYLTFLVAWMHAQGFGAGLVALTWAVLGVAVMISPFPWRRILAVSDGGLALALSSAGTAIGTLLPLLFVGPGSIVISAAIFGLSFFIVPTAIMSFGRKNLVRAQWGTSFALFTTLFAFGQILGPITAGFIADWTNSITLGLTSAGVIILISALIFAAQNPIP